MLGVSNVDNYDPDEGRWRRQQRKGRRPWEQIRCQREVEHGWYGGAAMRLVDRPQTQVGCSDRKGAQ